jgi:hypothetical protein
MTIARCAWGLPQIMGNECQEVGFASAIEMVDYLTSLGRRRPHRTDGPVFEIASAPSSAATGPM